MAKKYEIKKVAPHVYLDGVDNAVQGFKITLYLPEFDETQFLNVPNTNPSTVKAAADQLYADRVEMSALGD